MWKIMFFLLAVSAISLRVRMVLKKCLHYTQAFVSYLKIRGGNLKKEDSEELELTKEEKRVMAIVLELSSLKGLMSHLDEDYVRVARARLAIQDKISILEEELDNLKQGQLIL